MKKLKQKKLLGLLGIAAGIVVVSIGMVIWAFWYDLNVGFGAPSHPEFKGYTSSEQLNGNSLKSSYLVRYKEYALDDWWFDYVLSYDSGITVYERSVGNYPDVVANCDSRAKGASGDYFHTCDVFSMKSGGRYTVMTDTYKGKLFAVTVEALIDNTEFYVSIPEEKTEEFADYDGWQAYFDSLQPVNLETVPFDLKTHHQGGA